MLNICKKEKGLGMCALTGVTSGLIQPGKGDSQVTGECGDMKSVRYTDRAAAPSWQSSHTRNGEQSVAVFSSRAPIYYMHKPQSKQPVSYSLSFLSLVAQSSGWRRKQLWVLMLYAFLKIFCIL